MHAPQNRRERTVVGSVIIRNSDDLQSVNFYFFVAKHADASGSYSIQEPGIIAKLFVISCDEVHAVGGLQLREGRSGAAPVNGGAIVQISGDEDRVGLLFENLRNHAAQEAAIAHVTEMYVADQSCFRPRQASGRFSRRIRARVTRVQLALKT